MHTQNNLGGTATPTSPLNGLNIVQNPTDLGQPVAENELLRMPQPAGPDATATPVAPMPGAPVVQTLSDVPDPAAWERFLLENREEMRTPQPLDLIMGWVGSNHFTDLRNKRRGAWIYSQNGAKGQFSFVAETALQDEPMAAEYYRLYRSVAEMEGYDPEHHVVVVFDPKMGFGPRMRGVVCRRPNACTAMVNLPCTPATFKPLT